VGSQPPLAAVGKALLECSILGQSGEQLTLRVGVRVIARSAPLAQAPGVLALEGVQVITIGQRSADLKTWTVAESAVEQLANACIAITS